MFASGGGRKKGRKCGGSGPNLNVFALFDQKQISELKEAFSFIDQNADGIIDRSDLKELFTSLGNAASEEELDEMLRDLPRDSPGLNFTMFLAMMGERMQGMDCELDLLQAFERLDEGKKGSISTDLFKRYMTEMGDQFTENEFEEIIRLVDLTPQGHIDYRQFVQMLTHTEVGDNNE